MPDLGHKPHLRRLEGIFGGDADVDFEVAAFIGRVGRAVEVAFEVGEVGNLAAGGGGDGYAGEGVFVDILNFFLEAAGAVGHLGVVA